MVDRQRISEQEFMECVGRFSGRVVDHPWFSDHSVMYLEIGREIETDPPPHNPEHEHGIFMGYDWCLSMPGGRQIKRKDQGAEQAAEEQLTGSRIEAIRVSSSKQLVIEFAGGVMLASASEQGSGLEWDLREYPGRYVAIRDHQYSLEISGE